MMMLSPEPLDESPPMSCPWNSDPNQSDTESLWSLMTAIPGLPLIYISRLCSMFGSWTCPKFCGYIQHLDSCIYPLSKLFPICFWDLRRSGYLRILTFDFGCWFYSCFCWTKGFCPNSFSVKEGRWLCRSQECLESAIDYSAIDFESGFKARSF